jgi:hypothetical protein
MNHTINDGVHAVRHTGQRVLDRVENAAGGVAKEARGVSERLTHKNKKPDKKRGRAAGVAASVAAFFVALTVRRRRKQDNKSDK